MNILEKLWSGNICPCEEEGFWEDERRDLQALCLRNSDELLATLNIQEKQTLEKLQDCQTELQQYAECSAFIVGFRLAVQLMTASMCNAPKS